MERKNQPLTLDTIKSATTWRNQTLDKFKIAVFDSDPAGRMAAQECVICFVGSKLGGAAMTTANCAACNTVMQFGSTCVDNLCTPCAVKYELCKHCGADIHLRKRTKINKAKSDG